MDDYVDRIVGQGRFVGSIVLHPYHDEWDAMMSKANYVIDRVRNETNTMLTTWSEIAELYVARQGISMDTKYIQFGVGTPAGLTMECAHLQAGKTLRVGDMVLPKIGNRIIFPAMNAGVYKYALTNIVRFPVVTGVGVGMALKDGSYNITTGKTAVNVEGWNYEGTISGNIQLSRNGMWVLQDQNNDQVIRFVGRHVLVASGEYTMMKMGRHMWTPYNQPTWNE